jgi:hypothetical protein
MITSPFRFEADLTDEDYQKIGLLSLRWSHIDHMIAQSLKALLRLTDEEAAVVVFPLSTDLRLTRIRELQRLKSLPTEAAKKAFSELDLMMKGIGAVRNSVIHAVILNHGKPEERFQLRSKNRDFTKSDIFETEEVTNYVAHAALLLRHELGDKDPGYTPSALPNRPPIPKCLQRFIQVPKAPRRSSGRQRRRDA